MAAEPPVLDLPPDSGEVNLERFRLLKKAFQAKYGHEVEFFARAPGRVNIIGEHIDYMGYAVLPTAISNDIVIACRKTDSGLLRVANSNNLKYSDFEVKVNEVKIEEGGPWFNYFLCGFKGIVETAKLQNPTGMDVLLDGTIPKSAGLSSSSALVCCAALATMYANGAHMTKTEIASCCASCERYIGTEGGGMDQSISFLAEDGQAKLVEFLPKLKATEVKIPAGVKFVVSNTMVEANKASAFSYYNVRVVECRLAAQVISHLKGLAWKDTRKLCEVQNALSLSLEQMVTVVEETLHKEPYTRKEIAKILGISDDELREHSLKSKNATTLDLQTFHLHNRAKHVFSEAARVYKFKATCDASDPNATQILGELMNKSHYSCRDLYECSCPELDELTEICRTSGAVGSRLTGAGWGGCAVSMVPVDKLAGFLDAVRERYYRKIVDQALFATSAGAGAAVVKPFA
ncbi:N-acetylgalactosamine kinase-like [Oscarella lobularis]|uniref:N-acetylgalactosamine kinase-like n=1 Tax=Oscarella lobularis TaxID=121494 RepID=UPI003313E1DA